MNSANISLTSRTVLITGASSGIGEHLAEVIASAGARVVLGARRTNRTSALAERLCKTGHEALAVPLDVSDERSTIGAFDQAEQAFGTVDTIIANAGTSADGRSTDVAASAVRDLLNTNLLGVYLTAREGAKRMIAAKSRGSEKGRIVIIGSITAMMTAQGDAAYAASKAGVARHQREHSPTRLYPD
jgi:NAD(P)-dependent dehydrogenase (short-subunit alcohol dehydrogenase family)